MGTSTSRPSPRGETWAAVRRGFGDPGLSVRRAVVQMAGALDEGFISSLSGSPVAEALNGVLRRSREIGAAAGDMARLTSVARELRESLATGAALRKDASEAGELAREATTRTVLRATSPSSSSRAQLASAFLRTYVAALFGHLAARDLSRSLGRGRFMAFGQIAAFIQDVERHVEERAGDVAAEDLEAAEDIEALGQVLDEQIRRALDDLKQDPSEDAG
jgi:hypothetical protein